MPGGACIAWKLNGWKVNTDVQLAINCGLFVVGVVPAMYLSLTTPLTHTGLRHLRVRSSIPGFFHANWAGRFAVQEEEALGGTCS
eukprot:gene16075-20587_t